MSLSRRQCLRRTAAAVAGLAWTVPHRSGRCGQAEAFPDLQIAQMEVTPIALPDPPILAASGCHGPYFLRTIIQLKTSDGIVGVGETYGDRSTVERLERSRELVVGHRVTEYQRLQKRLDAFHPADYAGIEMACLDAMGQAVGLPVCQLLGGAVRDEVEFAAYLFYRYAADHPRVLDDPRLVDSRGRGERALDRWGEVRSAEAMTQMAAGFREQWGFRVLKLKAGVLDPDEEIRALAMMHERFGDEVVLRIDPNARWTVDTAIQQGNRIRRQELPLEYYEDPVAGQNAMAEVRTATGLKMATNSCVSRWRHVRDAVGRQPIDVVLADIYWFGGIRGVQALGQAAESLGWGLGYHSNNHAGITMAAMIHAAAVTPQLTYAADTHYVWLPPDADIIQGPNLPIVAGRMRVPRQPGLGVRLDTDKLARAHETYRRCGMRQRDDAETMRRFEPAWKRTLF